MTDPTPLTKASLDAALATQTEVIAESIRGLNISLTRQIGAVARDVSTLQKDVAQLKGDVADLKEDMALVKAGLMEYLDTDRSLHVLVEQLQTRGLKLDSAAIFPQPQRS